MGLAWYIIPLKMQRRGRGGEASLLRVASVSAPLGPRHLTRTAQFGRALPNVSRVKVSLGP